VKKVMNVVANEGIARSNPAFPDELPFEEPPPDVAEGEEPFPSPAHFPELPST